MHHSLRFKSHQRMFDTNHRTNSIQASNWAGDIENSKYWNVSRRVITWRGSLLFVRAPKVSSSRRFFDDNRNTSSNGRRVVNLFPSDQNTNHKTNLHYRGPRFVFPLRSNFFTKPHFNKTKERCITEHLMEKLFPTSALNQKRFVLVACLRPAGKESASRAQRP